LLANYHLWHWARIVGDASAYGKRDTVVAGIRKELTRQLCGDAWVQLEHAYYGHPDALALRQSVSSKPAHVSAIGLVAQGKVLTPDSSVEDAVNSINELSQSHHLLAGQHDPNLSRALVEFAYRLLNQPESLNPGDGPAERMIVASLLQNSVLCRMVRLSFLIAESADEPATVNPGKS